MDENLYKPIFLLLFAIAGFYMGRGKFDKSRIYTHQRLRPIPRIKSI